jgi:hypothetical protein
VNEAHQAAAAFIQLEIIKKVLNYSSDYKDNYLNQLDLFIVCYQGIVILFRTLWLAHSAT